MNLIKVITLFCCTNVAKGITSTITDPVLQEFKINRQISKNNHRQGVRHHHRQAIVPGQAITFGELLNLVKEAQKAVTARRVSSGRRFRPKVGGRTRIGTMDAFRRMLELVATYNEH